MKKCLLCICFKLNTYKNIEKIKLLSLHVKIRYVAICETFQTKIRQQLFQNIILHGRQTATFQNSFG